MGIHGEPGVWRDKLQPADAIAGELMDRLLADLPLKPATASRPRQQPRRDAAGGALHPFDRMRSRVAMRSARRSCCRSSGATPPRWRWRGLSFTLLPLDGSSKRCLSRPGDCAFWRCAMRIDTARPAVAIDRLKPAIGPGVRPSTRRRRPRPARRRRPRDHFAQGVPGARGHRPGAARRLGPGTVPDGLGDLEGLEFEFRHADGDRPSRHRPSW